MLLLWRGYLTGESKEESLNWLHENNMEYNVHDGVEKYLWPSITTEPIKT